ncbi:hypothetical protein [Niabella sp.]|uniref:hypothetical protein n=1 Tax=Niabella sp. TaxID=1962976 RepID=UPI002635F366|nr:hypothetical protein [Niabella sp.]
MKEYLMVFPVKGQQNSSVMFKFISFFKSPLIRKSGAGQLPEVIIGSSNSGLDDSRIFKTAHVKAAKRRNRNYYRGIQRLKKYRFI